MALRNQPYFPLYVKDFRSDDKLARCSASSHGVYILLLCILHSEQEYGKIMLRQKERQNSSTIKNFADVFVRMMPFNVDEIEDALTELVDFDVIQIDGCTLYQKRMVKDGKISELRAFAGKKGSDITNGKHDFAAAKQSAKPSAKIQQNTESEYVDVNEVADKKDEPLKKNKRTINKFIPPTLEEIKAYITEKNYNVNPKTFYDYFTAGDWVDKNGSPVRSWKQKIITWHSNSDNQKKGDRVEPTEKDYTTSTSAYEVL